MTSFFWAVFQTDFCQQFWNLLLGSRRETKDLALEENVSGFSRFEGFSKKLPSD
jgi:hypothetical protein